ncbi:MAG: hypothetical protein IKE50_05365 [Erysipelotrichaceae bacterium]|nr:hypothetical protein [Erysipelotrichaceae bacterium]
MSRIKPNINMFIIHIIFFLIAISGFFCVFSFSEGINFYDLYDFIEGVFWAEASLKSHSIVNPDYVYYYVVPFGSNIIMAPLVKLFGVSFFSNQVGMLFFFFIYLCTLYRLSKSLYENIGSRLLFCSITSLFIYTYAGDNLLHHLLCYGIGFVCFLGELSCIVNIRNHRNTHLNSVLLIVFCLWSSANGVVTVALCTIPVLLGFLYLLYCQKKINKDDLIVLSLVIIFTIAGLFVYRHYNSTAFSLNQYVYRFIFADTDRILSNLSHNLFSDYLKVFYFNPTNVSLLSSKGLFALIRLAFSLSLIIFPLFSYHLRRSKSGSTVTLDESRKLLLWSSSVVLFICVFQYTLFKTSVQRYLFNGILSIFLINAFLFTDRMNKQPQMILQLSVLILVVSLSLRTIFYTFPMGEKSKEKLIQINDILNQEGLSYGYTTMRYYKVLELISKGKNKNTTIAYDEERGLFIVEYDRIYLHENEKPSNLTYFYVLTRDVAQNAEEKEFIPLLEKIKSNKIVIADVSIYVIDIDSWDKIFAER